MEFELEQAVALLERTPAALDVLLRSLPDAWTRTNEGEGTWTVFETVGHMAYCERVGWIQRVQIALEGGSFGPLNREGYGDRGTLAERLDEFARLRVSNLAELRAMHMGPEELARMGIHPAFGAVTVGQLLATWTAHDMTHLHQISRVLAYQYRGAVGPWVVNLGVMRCGGNKD